jgi:Ribonuclease P
VRLICALQQWFGHSIGHYLGSDVHDTHSLSKEVAGVLAWAYVVHVRTAKGTLGKRAVVRNRAQRRVAAAVRLVFPAHAARGREYVLAVLPHALVAPFPDLVDEARAALAATRSWRDALGDDELRRPWYRRRHAR